MEFKNWRRLIPIRRWREPRPLVTVLRLEGVIGKVSRFHGGLTLKDLEPVIERAFAPSHLNAVALAINSPGGSPVQASLIADRIRAMAAEKNVPVVAFAEDVAASGGYMLALAADEIFVHADSIVGSIGVISSSFGFTGLIEKIGVERRLHTAGEKKSMLDPFLPEDAKDVERLKAIQKEIHEDFKEMVKTRREGKLKGRKAALFTGEFWTGAKALELGLVDGIGELRTVMRERHGDKVRLRPVAEPKGWLRRRFSMGGRMGGQMSGAAWADDLVESLEQRALWSRFGL